MVKAAVQIMCGILAREGVRTAFCTRHVSARWRACSKSVTIAANTAGLTLPLALCIYASDVEAGQQDIDDAGSLNLLMENDAFAATDRHSQAAHVDTWSLLVGTVGPHAKGEALQSAVHDLLGTNESRGWDNQSLPGSGYFVPHDKWAWYLFVGVDGRLVERNIFVDDNDLKSQLTIDKKRWVNDVQAGLVVTRGDFRLAYTFVHRSEEFRQQLEPDRFGSLGFTWRY